MPVFLEVLLWIYAGICGPDGVRCVSFVRCKKGVGA